MTSQTVRSIGVISLVTLTLALAGTHVAGQRGSAGPHLKALPAKLYTPSRTPDGQPDLQGEWNPLMRMGSPSHSLEEGGDPADSIPQGQGSAHLQASHQGVVIDPPDGRIPYQPAVAAIRKQLLEGVETPTKRSDLDTNDRCLALGVPRFAVFPFQIAQRPGHVVLLSGWGHLYRSIPLDNRPHLSQNLKLWMGNSRGHWEGNTLVVDVTNNNDKFWIDSHATIHSDALHVVERFTLVDANTLFYQATVEDPKVYTRPWTMALTLDRSKDPKPEIWEEGCWEGERSVPNMLAVGRKAKSEGKTGVHEHRYEYWLSEALKMEAAKKAATPEK